ncbi:hypothetical protein L3Y34_002152 [Caenorhabditis briggsae]|uniref:Uncharacterized protein n=1 Tax=Caenorhabditis briggsae TaxID=6238 RepID=A0AAE9DFF9_CAEBR|nr:hypothetical protein L3Y34_002152 [Caenorhabditis briggsae]
MSSDAMLIELDEDLGSGDADEVVSVNDDFVDVISLVLGSDGVPDVLWRVSEVLLAEDEDEVEVRAGEVEAREVKEDAADVVNKIAEDEEIAGVVWNCPRYVRGIRFL